MEIEYSHRFSDDVGSFFRSPVREIFKRVDLNAIYSFAGGYPSADTFPAEAIKQTIADAIDRYGSRVFQYGATQGVPELRRAVAERYGVDEERILISTSSQQGIDVCTRVLVNPGDVILTSAPSYLGAMQSFHSYRATIVGVQHHPNIDVWRQMYVDAIEMCRAQGKCIKFLYMIPDFQNPSGETLTLNERRVLAELAERYDFLIVEDSPYRELRYEGEPVPTLYSLAPERVIHLGSFSKIFAPGFRLGWIIANPEIIDRIYVCKQSLDLCAPILDQYVAAEFLSSGRLDANLKHSIELYHHKRDIMLNLLAKHMPKGVTWTHPEGGLFIFLRLPEWFDTVKLYDVALSRGVAYVAGSFFYPDGSCRNTMRMNFSFMAEERMPAGVELLASILREEIAKHNSDDTQ